MEDAVKREDISRLGSIVEALEKAFFEAIEAYHPIREPLGPVALHRGVRFVPTADMITMMDFSGEVSGFAAVAADPAEIRSLMGARREWAVGDDAEDMLQELVNHAANAALQAVRTENGILSCSAPRTVYGRISIPRIPCVTREYELSAARFSFTIALDRMESDLVRLHHQLLDRERALRDEIERRRIAEQRLEFIASTDVLTGSSTRRRFMELAGKLVEHARSTLSSLAVIVADIDHFKQINDTFGHGAGDEVLRIVGEKMRSIVRKDDLVGRIGGEEFAICLPDARVERASVLAERIRYELSQMEIPLLNGQKIHCTASFGVAQLEKHDLNLESVLHRADLAMYCSKRNGRDQVALAS